MAETVSDKDLRTLVDLLEEGRRQSPPVGLPQVVLELIQRLVRCDELSFLEFDPVARRGYLYQDISEAIVDPEDDSEDEAFWHHFWDDLECSYSVRTGDERTVTTSSDFYSRREWHQSGMYVDYLGKYGIENTAIVCISSPAGRTRRLVLFRGPGPDFDHRDRLLLSLLRPHLDELYQDLQRSRQADLSLTRRQHQILGLVAAGYTNSEIARKLVVSTTTVRTHLENVFRQLQVTNRSAAVAKAFPVPPL
jgi:DNA-binding CsgD family transcriptional regulator